MKRRLVIAGAGGFGSGVYGWVSTSPKFLGENAIESIVFIDDDEGLRAPGPVVASISAYEPAPNDLILCAVGVIGVRERIVASLAARGAVFATFIDDRAVIGAGVRVGTGSIVCPGTVLSSRASLGSQVHVNFNCSIGHDTSLGDFCTLSPSVNIMGQVDVGSRVFVGGSAVVLPRLSIGVQSIVGAGAVVTRAVEHGLTVVGNPARNLVK